jgi:EAL domain-containing protein (putative c-di-GMP-specific phosphodiesterase class I)
LVHLREAGHREMRVAVNLSPRQLEDGAFVEVVRECLERNRLPKGALELEITEGLMMKDLALTHATLEELRELGVRASIDDFGTGYSSLAYLQKLPVDALKVDRSFVSGENASNSIASVIIGLAHKLGLEVIGEGVETEGQLGFLRSEGCDLAQGYLLSRPLDFASLSKWLASRVTTQAVGASAVP